MIDFEIIGQIDDIETIAVGKALRELSRLRRQYGQGRWRKLKGTASIRLPSGRVRRAGVPWYEAHGVGRKEIKRKRYLDWDMNDPRRGEPTFAVCINNRDHPASLELHKIYRVLPDEHAAQDGAVRVVDEAGEDYLYPAVNFVVIEVSADLRSALLAVP